MKSKAIAIGVTVILVLVVTQNSLSQTATAPSGSGTSVSPYQIDSLPNLYWITRNSGSWGSYFTQTADIDASSDSSWNSGAGFTPIGPGSGFTGTYEGNGHSISGLLIYLGSGSNAGLFSFTLGATIKNIKLTNVRVTVTGGGGYVGGLVGDNETSSIDSCSVSGIVSSAGNAVGGLVGRNNNASGASTITNSSSSATVTGGSSAGVGGLVGYNYASNITGCFNTGTVADSLSNANIGGLVGNDENGSSITDSYSSGTVRGSGGVQNVGGLVGYLSISSVESCYVSGTVHGHDQNIGGLAGFATGTTSPSTIQSTVTGSHSTATVIGDSNFVGGLIGDVNTEVSLTNCYSGGSVTGADQYVGGLVGSSNQVTAIRNCYSTANVTGGTDVGGLIGYGNGVNTGFSTIDSSYATGMVNGGGYVGGFIGYTTGTAITNSHSSGRVLSTGSFSGGFAGEITGASTVTDCYSAGSDSGANYAGGFAGISDTYTIITGSYSTGKVQGASDVGGFVGYTFNSAGMSNCYGIDTVVATGNNVGGLVGGDGGAGVDKCYSTGSVTGSSLIGGLIGSNIGGSTNSFWDTQTSGQSSSSYGDIAATTSQMQTQSTFTSDSWDFSSTWAIDPSINGGFPGLLWQSQFVAAAPSAATNASTNVLWSSATLNGTVSPYKGSTTVKFIYGTVSGLYPDTIAASQSPVSGWGSATVSASVSGLSATTTYFFRVIASSSYGSSQGSELSFMTIATPTISTVPGTALSFDKNLSQYITVPDNASLELTDSLTFEAWVYPTGSGNMTVIDKGSYNYLFAIKPNGQPGLGFYNGNTGWIYTTQAVPDSQWSFVAVAFNNGTLDFYLNGSLLKETTTSSSLTTNTGPFAIGQQGPGGTCNCNFFNGVVDEVRVWKVPRTEQQIRADMYKTLTGAETGLVSYWQLNEGSQTAAYDVVGGNNGTLTNGPTWVTSDAPVGKYGVSDTTSSPDSAGQSSSTVTATITSHVDSLDFLGLYSYGSASDTAITSETFPSGITKRSPVIWGIFEVGSDTANITLSYSGITSLVIATNLKVLEREEADSLWADVTSNFTQNVSAQTFTENGVGTFSQFAIGVGSTPLPVEMASFTATSSKLSANLQWKTATEVNTNGFEIERQTVSGQQAAVSDIRTNSQSTIGNPQWIPVAFVKGHGTSSAPNSYSFVDRDLSAGTYSYRLKQIDQDGSSRLSKEVTVEVGNAPRVFTLSQNYPNPFNPTTTIEFTLEKDGHVSLKVYDILGREVATLLDENRKAGEYQQVVFDGSRYSSGVYFAVLQSGGKVLLKKMLMLK